MSAIKKEVPFDERPYSRYQVSKKYPNSVIYVVEGDTLEEMLVGIQETKEYLKEEGLLQQDEPNPVTERQDAVGEESQDPSDPKVCPVHNVAMTLHWTNDNTRQYWRHDTDDPAFVKNSQYSTVYCFGK